MSVFLYAVVQEGGVKNQGEFLSEYSVFFLFFATYYAFNYLINDYFDKEADRKAGKPKVIQSVPDRVTLLALSALFLLGTVSLWIREEYAPKMIAVSLLVYLLGISYSVKGLRMKERGLWGLTVSAFAQRNSPVLLASVMKNMDLLSFWLWMTISFANGLRYILIHQLLDRENDRKAGLHTFVSDKRAGISAAVLTCFFLEILSLLLLFWRVLSVPLTWVLIASYLSLCVLNADFLTHVTKQSWLYSFGNVPLEDFYNLFLPLILTAALSCASDMYGLLLVTVIYLFPTMRRKLGMPFMDVRIRLQKAVTRFQDGKEREKMRKF